MHTFSYPASVSCRYWIGGLCCLLLASCSEPVSVPPNEQPIINAATLCPRITSVLAQVRDGRQLSTATQGAWQVVHGVLAFGEDFSVLHEGLAQPALDYLFSGAPLRGWNLRHGDHGIVAVVEEGSTLGQGHPDQWLGYLSQCGRDGIPLDRKLIVATKAATVGDLLTQAQADLRPGQEATWTLMALATYLPETATWQAHDGSNWTIERVMQMELDADLATSACGGAHRLYGLATAVNRHRSRHPDWQETSADVWGQAHATITDCINRARRFQQADGSFSTQYFERPGTSPDVFAKLGSSGHIFEFLAVALPDSRLGEPWVVRAANRLVTILEQTADVDIECGALYHAAHGLLLYHDRLCALPKQKNTLPPTGSPKPSF